MIGMIQVWNVHSLIKKGKKKGVNWISGKLDILNCPEYNRLGSLGKSEVSNCTTIQHTNKSKPFSRAVHY